MDLSLYCVETKEDSIGKIKDVGRTEPIASRQDYMTVPVTIRKMKKVEESGQK